MVQLHHEEAASSSEQPVFVVAVALAPGKAKKHLTRELKETAARSGIQLLPFDSTQPLEALPRVDALLHKIRDQAWVDKLTVFARQHPEVKVVDSPELVKNVLSRSSMLSSVEAPGVLLRAPAAEAKQDTFRVCTPVQVSIPAGCSPDAAQQLADEAGLVPPLLAKPLWADGRNGAHEIALLLDDDGLRQLCSGRAPSGVALPVTLQQYVPHGACLYKVYVLGPITVVARRPSLQLPVQDKDVQERCGSVVTLVRVSAFHSETFRGEAPDGDPPPWLVESLAAELRQRTGLTLFNYDLLRPQHVQPARCPQNCDFLLIDLNYWPGFEKLPDYSNLMTRFLLSLSRPNSASSKRLTKTTTILQQEAERGVGLLNPRVSV